MAGKKSERSRRMLKRSEILRHKLIDVPPCRWIRVSNTPMPGLECTHVEIPFEGAAHGASKSGTAELRSPHSFGGANSRRLQSRFRFSEEEEKEDV